METNSCWNVVNIKEARQSIPVKQLLADKLLRAE